jgi:hypothetical protein
MLMAAKQLMKEKAAAAPEQISPSWIGAIFTHSLYTVALMRRAV